MTQVPRTTSRRGRLRYLSLVALVGALMTLGLVGGGIAGADPGLPVSDDGVVPVEYDRNVSCQFLGYAFGFKIEGQGGAAYTGTFPFDRSNGGIHTGGAPDDPYNSVTTSSDGFLLDWSATLGIDAVIMKGGPDSNAYVYVPEDTADGGLASPQLDNGNLPAISHVEFCYDYELTATKTANAEYTRTYTWDITKSVDPAAHSGFAGDTFSSDYDVVLDQTVTDSDFAVSGSITVNNPTPFTVSFVATDSVGGTPAAVSCPTNTLAPGANTICTYTASLESKTDGTNTATVTSNTAGVGGATATADYAFGDPTTTVGYPTVNVTDYFDGDETGEGLGSASGDFTFEYDRDFACPTDADAYTGGVFTDSFPNTAEIDETGQSDDANVDLTCYAPVVTKDATTGTYDQYYTWDVEKSVAPESQFGYPGDKLEWTWTVDVTKTPSAADGFFVSGNIYVANPNPNASMTVDVSDVLDDGTIAVVDCDAAAGNQTSLTVPAGGSGTCSWSATPADASATLNTATATINRAGFIGTADVIWAANDVNGTGTVTDDQGPLNESLSGNGPWQFEYTDDHTCSSLASAYGAGGTYGESIDNTAIVTSGGIEQDRDTATTEYTCEAVFISLLKLTDGVETTDITWNFALYEGPDGFGTTAIATDSTPPALLDFGGPALRPDTTYTVCELAVPAGWSSAWSLNGGTVLPYNPDADNQTPEDLGNRCFDFGGTVEVPAETGTTFSFTVDNRAPGGDPRTPGYWKNWNRCTGGRQQYTAAETGHKLLEDILTSPGIRWDDILTDNIVVNITNCEQAVEILDSRVVNVDGKWGKKLASDPARNLARSLLAAQLNFGAGACTTADVLAAALQAETLLDKYDFDGTRTTAYPLSSSDKTLANNLAKYLDDYNNGMYCGSLVP